MILKFTIMKLITKEIASKLSKSPIYSTEGKSVKDVLVKFFNPYGVGTWLVFEAEKDGDDYLFFWRCRFGVWI